MNSTNKKAVRAIVESGMNYSTVKVSDACRAAGIKQLKKPDAILAAERAAENLNKRNPAGYGWRVMLYREVTSTHGWFNALIVTCCEFD